MEIEITDNSGLVKKELAAAVLRALEKCGLEAEGCAKTLSPVDTGNLRNSITHQVIQGEQAVYIGTNSEYGPYVELGTGKYYPGGRQTHGQRAQPYLKPAVTGHRAQYRSIIEGELKNG